MARDKTRQPFSWDHPYRLPVSSEIQSVIQHAKFSDAKMCSLSLDSAYTIMGSAADPSHNIEHCCGPEYGSSTNRCCQTPYRNWAPDEFWDYWEPCVSGGTTYYAKQKGTRPASDAPPNSTYWHTSRTIYGTANIPDGVRIPDSGNNNCTDILSSDGETARGINTTSRCSDGPVYGVATRFEGRKLSLYGSQFTGTSKIACGCNVTSLALTADDATGADIQHVIGWTPRRWQSGPPPASGDEYYYGPLANTTDQGPSTTGYYIDPDTGQSYNNNPRPVYKGYRLLLPATFDETTLQHPWARIFARALKYYGALINEGGVSGTTGYDKAQLAAIADPTASVSTPKHSFERQFEATYGHAFQWESYNNHELPTEAQYSGYYDSSRYTKAQAAAEQSKLVQDIKVIRDNLHFVPDGGEYPWSYGGAPVDDFTNRYDTKQDPIAGDPYSQTAVLRAGLFDRDVDQDITQSPIPNSTVVDSGKLIYSGGDLANSGGTMITTSKVGTPTLAAGTTAKALRDGGTTFTSTCKIDGDAEEGVKLTFAADATKRYGLIVWASSEHVDAGDCEIVATISDNSRPWITCMLHKTDNDKQQWRSYYLEVQPDSGTPTVDVFFRNAGGQGGVALSAYTLVELASTGGGGGSATVETIIDNVDAGFSVDGAWSTSSSRPDRYGADYKYIASGDGTKKAHWLFSAVDAGDLEVFEWHPSYSGYAPNAPYEIWLNGSLHSSGTIDQTGGGGAWNRLISVPGFGGGTVELIITAGGGGTNTAADAAKIAVTQQVTDNPTFDPPSGASFTGSGSVVIDCATPGATIYFTTDGTTPTNPASGSTQSAAAPLTVNITGDTTINALAVASGHADSSVVSASYTVTDMAVTSWEATAADTPVTMPHSFDPALHDRVVLLAEWEGAADVTISPTFNGVPMAFIDEVSVQPGWPRRVSAYELTAADLPTSAGDYDIVTTPSAWADIGGGAYSLAGTDQAAAIITEKASQLAGAGAPISVSANLPNERLVITGNIASNTGTFTPDAAFTEAWDRGDANAPNTHSAYRENVPAGNLTVTHTASADRDQAMLLLAVPLASAAPVATPVLSPGGGTYPGSVDVSISCDTPGATIHYTLDGTPPTPQSAVYSGPLTITSTTTVKAIAVKDSMADSAIASEDYAISAGHGTPVYVQGDVALPLASVAGALAVGAAPQPPSAAVFPSYAILLRDGYQEAPDPVVERTQMESGPPKQAPRASRTMTGRPLRYGFDSLDDYQAFRAWHRDIIAHGTGWFDWTDPVDGSHKAARIINGEIKAHPTDHHLQKWIVSFSLETWG